MKAVRRTAGPAVAGLAAIMVLGACGGGSGSSASGQAPPAKQPPPAAAETNNPSGDIPDSQVYVPYTPKDGLFTVKVPEGWAQAQEGSATVFSDKLNSVRVQALPAATAPSVASAQTDEIAKIKATAQGFSLGQVTMVQRKAGPAVVINYRAESPPNPVTGKTVTDAVQRYEFWRGSQEVVLSLTGPVTADNVDPWRTITDSLRWNR